MFSTLQIVGHRAHSAAPLPSRASNCPPRAYSRIFEGKPLAHAIDRHFRQPTSLEILRPLNVER